ncbi:MAG: adenylate/guanylate cyclase domain-containing protein [Thalassobaculaceae bacterium]
MGHSPLNQLPELAAAEMQADLLSAFVRVGILLVLLATVVFSLNDQGVHMGAAIDVGLYGVATGASLILAWRRVYHPSLPYAFATFDVILIVAHMQVMARMMGLDAGLVSLPAAALMFVVLIHASMRYQPALIGYIVLLFLVSVLIASSIPAPGTAMQQHVGVPPATGHRQFGKVFAFDILPPALVVTAGAILIVGGYRTRRLLMQSIDQAARSARLSRFFSPSIAESLSRGDLDGLASGLRQPVAVLFVDIKGFTSMAETMSPEEVGAVLSEFRERVTDCVFSHGGTVDKFIGDAVMVVFGAPRTNTDDAKRAVECGSDILRSVADWSEDRVHRGGTGIEIGVGGHYGDVFVGVLGSGRLLEYTVIGDTVNVAERLERLSRETDCSFVVSRKLLEAAELLTTGGDWSELGGRALRGRASPVEAMGFRSVSGTNL